MKSTSEQSICRSVSRSVCRSVSRFCQSNKPMSRSVGRSVVPVSHSTGPVIE